MLGPGSAEQRKCAAPRPGHVRHDRRRLRLEKTVRRILGRALPGHRLLQPFDLGIHQRDAFGQFLDRQQRQILSDLVGDFLPGLVVILDGQAFPPCLAIPLRRLPAAKRLANQASS